MPVIPETIDSTYGISVRDFGARGDGVSDDSEGIQQALDAGHRLVTIPMGVYKIGKTLRVSSNTDLRVHPAAHLFLADHAGTDQNTYLITNKNRDRGDCAISIQGGLWDGNNRGNTRGPDRPGSYTGVMVDFSNVKGLEMREATLLNPESYYIRVGEVRDFRFEKIRFQVTSHRPNQDGIHVAGFCEHGVIRDVAATGRGATNDDIVAILSDDDINRAQNLGVKCGAIRDIRVQTIRADDCHTFIRLLSVFAPIEDIDIQDVAGGCQVSALNFDASRYCMKPVFDPKDPNYQCDVGTLSRVRIRDLSVHRSRAGHPNPLLVLETKMKDVLIENLHRDMSRDADPSSPTMRIAFLNQPGLVMEGLTREQVGAIKAASSPLSAKFSVLASADHAQRLRGELDITAKNTLIVPDGGFDRLMA